MFLHLRLVAGRYYAYSLQRHFEQVHLLVLLVKLVLFFDWAVETHGELDDVVFPAELLFKTVDCRSLEPNFHRLFVGDSMYIHADDEHDESYGYPDFASAGSVGFKLGSFKLDVQLALIFSLFQLGQLAVGLLTQLALAPEAETISLPQPIILRLKFLQPAAYAL